MEKPDNGHFRATTRLIKRYFVIFKKQLILVTVFSLISAVGNGVVPGLIGKFFDAIIHVTPYHILGYTVMSYVVLLVGWSAIQLATSYTDWRISNLSFELGHKASFEYAYEFYNHLINLPMSFHKSNKMGELESKVNRASRSLETIFSSIIISLTPQFVSIIIGSIITFFIYWPLAIVLLVGITTYMWIAFVKVKGSVGLQKAGYSAWNDSYGYAFDVVQNILAVKQATTEVHERKEIESRFKTKLYAIWQQIEEFWNNLRYFQSVIIVVCQIIIFVSSIFLIASGRITIGDLIALNGYSAMMFTPFVTLMTNWQNIQDGITNIGNNEEILSLSTENFAPSGSHKITKIEGNIEFKNVSFSYDADKPILTDISFVANKGEIIALVGESGVGKSTLIDLISGLHFPSAGEVFIDGHDIRTINLTQLRRSIGVVPQEVVLFNDTIMVNIKYGNFDSTDEQVKEAARKAHAVEFIEKFPGKWDQLVGERGVKLSVGQKQRVAIARAVLRDPKILVLDEPTSALDAGSEKIITTSLENLMEGKTTFIIAHRLSTVRHADKIIVLKDGRIVEIGKHAELIKKEGSEYRRLHELQIGLT